MSIFNIQISKLNVLESFDTDKLPASSVDYATEYGLRKSINDAHAAVKREAYDAGDTGQAKWLADVRKAAYARVEQIRTGTTPRSNAVSPVLVAMAQAGMTEADILALITQAAKKKAA